MKIYPAIDIRNGKCVRLFQGKLDKETVYDNSPLLEANKWVEKGAKFLHIVDLDGAFTGNQKNIDTIKEIVENTEVEIQVGGGIRTLEKARKLIELGVDRIIVGTSAVNDGEFVEKLVKEFGDRVIVSIDAKDGIVCTEGWVEVSGLNALEFAKNLEDKGIKTIVYTDISKDGTMIGPNFDELQNLSKNTNLNIIASGGISKKEHVDELEKMGIYGAIIGKALYEGRLKLEKLMTVSKGEEY